MLDALFVLLAQVAAGAPAEPAQPAARQTEQAAQETAQNDDRNHRRCRVETVTGSRMGARVCRSRAEEEAQSAEGRRVLENAMRMWDNQSSASGGTNGP